MIVTSSSEEPKSGVTSTRLESTSDKMNGAVVSSIVNPPPVLLTVNVTGPNGKSTDSPRSPNLNATL